MGRAGQDAGETTATGQVKEEKPTRETTWLETRKNERRQHQDPKERKGVIYQHPRQQRGLDRGL